MTVMKRNLCIIICRSMNKSSTANKESASSHLSGWFSITRASVPAACVCCSAILHLASFFPPKNKSAAIRNQMFNNLVTCLWDYQSPFLYLQTLSVGKRQVCTNVCSYTQNSLSLDQCRINVYICQYLHPNIHHILHCQQNKQI